MEKQKWMLMELAAGFAYANELPARFVCTYDLLADLFAFSPVAKIKVSMPSRPASNKCPPDTCIDLSNLSAA